MTHSPDDARRLLCELGDHIRDAVVVRPRHGHGGDRGRDRAPTRSTRSTASPTTRCSQLVRGSTGPTSRWSPRASTSRWWSAPTRPWTVIVDTIDGTRGLMYDKRPAWCLAAAAPRGGSLRDIVAAAMTELPTVKQGAADQLSGTRGAGVVAERIDLHDGRRHRAHRATVVGQRPRARLRRAREVLRSGQDRSWSELEAKLFAAPRQPSRVRRRVHLVGRAAA